MSSPPNMWQLEKKRQEYESISEQKKMMEAQMNILNQKADREKEELEHMTRELHRAGLDPGHQSEPTTPPERYDQNLSSVFSRSNRYSSSSLTSPPGINTRSSRSGSQLTSPPSEPAQIFHNNIGLDALPSKSVPSSRRGSNDRVTAYVPETNGAARRNAAAYDSILNECCKILTTADILLGQTVIPCRLLV